MVLSSSDPAESFVIVFLPHESYINSFIADNQNLLKMVQEENSKNIRTSVIYHSMPISVIRNPIYRQEFMLKFGEHVQHILDCPET
jgi:hypothetical protein